MFGGRRYKMLYHPEQIYDVVAEIASASQADERELAEFLRALAGSVPGGDAVAVEVFLDWLRGDLPTQAAGPRSKGNSRVQQTGRARSRRSLEGRSRTCWHCGKQVRSRIHTATSAPMRRVVGAGSTSTCPPTLNAARRERSAVLTKRMCRRTLCRGIRFSRSWNAGRPTSRPPN